MKMDDKELQQHIKKWSDGSASTPEKRTLASAIGNNKYADGTSILLDLLEDPDAIVRYGAIISLGFDLHYKPATERLLDILTKDEDIDVRHAAAGSLGRIWLNSTNPMILRALGNLAISDPDLHVREGAYRALLTVNGLSREEHLKLLQQQDVPIDSSRLNSILSNVK